MMKSDFSREAFMRRRLRGIPMVAYRMKNSRPPAVTGDDRPKPKGKTFVNSSMK